ncbi:MAG: hypothetical protein AB7T63_03900 [Planctomycetota bacterium]
MTDRKPPRRSIGHIAARLEQHTGQDMEHESTVRVPVERTGEIWEVGVHVFREVGPSPRRTWYAWRMPQDDQVLLCAVAASKSVKTPQQAVQAGISAMARDPDTP